MSSQTETITQTTEETIKESNSIIPPPPIKIPVDIVPEQNESFTPISVVIQPTQHHRRYPILIANNVERRNSLFRITGRELYFFYFKILFFLIIFIVGLIIIFNYFKSK